MIESLVKNRLNLNIKDLKYDYLSEIEIDYVDI